MEEEIVKIEEVNNTDVIYSQDKALVDTQVLTARAYPRNVARALQNAIAFVTMDKETASTCGYAVPRAGKVVTGASVHLAKILMQEWGNLRVEAKVIGIDAKHVTSQAIAFDLEKNIAIKVEVKRSIVGKNGRFSDDMIVVTGNAGNSIALRNAILGVIPKIVVDKVYKSAQQTITGDVSTENALIARRKQVVDGLINAFSITEKEVLFAIGKQTVSHITAEDLVVLIGIGQAIKDGDTTVEESFKNKKTTNVTAMEEKKEEIKVVDKNVDKNAKEKVKNPELPLGEEKK